MHQSPTIYFAQRYQGRGSGRYKAARCRIFFKYRRSSKYKGNFVNFFSKFCANHAKRKKWNFWSKKFQPFFEGWKFSTLPTGRYYQAVCLFKKLALSGKASSRYTAKTMPRKKRTQFSPSNLTTHKIWKKIRKEV